MIGESKTMFLDAVHNIVIPFHSENEIIQLGYCKDPHASIQTLLGRDVLAIPCMYSRHLGSHMVTMVTCFLLYCIPPDNQHLANEE